MAVRSVTKLSVRPAISRILLATDFSPQAEKALRWARRMADGFGAKLVLLHVIDIFALGAAGVTIAGPIPLPSLLTEAKQDMKRWQDVGA